MTEEKVCLCKSSQVEDAAAVKQVADILERYQGQRGVIIPVLQAVQEEFGYLPRPALAQVGKSLGMSVSEIFGVLTFYAQFRTKPSGRNVVRVCRGTACHVKGGGKVLEEVEKVLGIKEGESTPDLQYTLETVACIGACALAPTVVIGKETFGQMNTKKIDEVFAARGKA